MAPSLIQRHPKSAHVFGRIGRKWTSKFNALEFFASPKRVYQTPSCRVSQVSMKNLTPGVLLIFGLFLWSERAQSTATLNLSPRAYQIPSTRYWGSSKLVVDGQEINARSANELRQAFGSNPDALEHIDSAIFYKDAAESTVLVSLVMMVIDPLTSNPDDPARRNPLQNAFVLGLFGGIGHSIFRNFARRDLGRAMEALNGTSREAASLQVGPAGFVVRF